MDLNLGLLTQDSGLGSGTNLLVNAVPGKFGCNEFCVMQMPVLQDNWTRLFHGHITEEGGSLKP